MFFIRTGTSLIRRLADTRDRGQRTVDQADHLAETDSFRRHQEVITATLAPFALDEAPFLELHQDLFQKLDRETLLLGQFADLDKRTPKIIRDPNIN